MTAAREDADDKLIELGRLFQQAMAEARPLEKERLRLFDVWQQACQAAGLPDDRYTKAAARIAKETGYDAASNAFTAKHLALISLMKAIHKAKATTFEGAAVKVAAIAFDQSDFEVSRPVPTDVAERELYRLARDMAKAVASNAARGVSA
jgi:hypothetical protein